MATTKANSTNSKRGGSNGRTTQSRSGNEDNVALRAARTVRDRPYASAAIATGAVTAVAAAAAGAFFFTRRDKSFREASEELTTRVRDGFTGASDKVRELAERGTGLFTSDEGSSGNRSQQEIAEEALSLKESALDDSATSGIKAGAVAY